MTKHIINNQENLEVYDIAYNRCVNSKNLKYGFRTKIVQSVMLSYEGKTDETIEVETTSKKVLDTLGFEYNQTEKRNKVIKAILKYIDGKIGVIDLTDTFILTLI